MAEINALHIKVTGSVHNVATCGELLAWLGAVIQSQTQTVGVYLTPSIVSLGSENQPRHIWLSDSTPHSTLFASDASFDIGNSEIETDATIAGNWRWLKTSLDCEFVAVTGYPVLRQQEEYIGLDVSQSIMQRLFGTSTANITNGRTFLRGQRTTLALVNQTDNVFFWHTLNIPGNICHCGYEPKPFHAVESGTFIIPYDGRHIIGQCHHALVKLEGTLLWGAI